jgi:hypothetical protein
LFFDLASETTELLASLASVIYTSALQQLTIKVNHTGTGGKPQTYSRLYTYRSNKTGNDLVALKHSKLIEKVILVYANFVASNIIFFQRTWRKNEK